MSIDKYEELKRRLEAECLRLGDNHYKQVSMAYIRRAISEVDALAPNDAVAEVCAECGKTKDEHVAYGQCRHGSPTFYSPCQPPATPSPSMQEVERNANNIKALYSVIGAIIYDLGNMNGMRSNLKSCELWDAFQAYEAKGGR